MHTMSMIAASALLLLACAKPDVEAGGETAMAASDSPAASTSAASSAVVRDAGGRELGTLTISEMAGSIAAEGVLRGMAPGEHGIHLHSLGRCDAPTFASAGAHWSPTARQHGTQNAKGPHLGDMLNFTVGADSTVTVHVMTASATLLGDRGLMDADGAAVVIHAKADDYRTDPSGNSGDRVACGVVAGG